MDLLCAVDIEVYVRERLTHCRVLDRCTRGLLMVPLTAVASILYSYSQDRSPKFFVPPVSV